MAVSTAPALKAAMHAAIRARAIAGVDVHYGMESRKIGQDVILLLGITSDEEPAAIGNLRREESYVLTVVVSVMRSFVMAPKAMTERAFAIYEELADLLRDDMSVGGVVRTAEPIGWELSEPANNEAGWRESAITARIRCRARI